jgi:hypothetical protein
MSCFSILHDLVTLNNYEAHYSTPSSAEIKNAWSYTYTPQYVFMARCLPKHRDIRPMKSPALDETQTEPR